MPVSCRASTTSSARCSPSTTRLHQHALQPPQGAHARARAACERLAAPGSRSATRRCCSRRERLRPHQARAGPASSSDPRPPLLPVPVRPCRGRGPLPHPRGQGPRDPRGPARPHHRLRRPEVRRRCARRRRQDPGHAELRRQLLGPQGDPSNYEGYITTYEEPAEYTPHDTAHCQYCQNPSPRARARRASPACSTASGCGSSPPASSRSTPVAPTRCTASRTPRSGCPMALARSRARRSRGLPSRPGSSCRSWSSGSPRPRRTAAAASSPSGSTDPGQEPRPAEGKPTATANHELL